MFREPIARELVKMFKILTWVWTYIYKEDPATREFKPKSRELAMAVNNWEL